MVSGNTTCFSFWLFFNAFLVKSSIILTTKFHILVGFSSISNILLGSCGKRPFFHDIFKIKIPIHCSYWNLIYIIQFIVIFIY